MGWLSTLAWTGAASFAFLGFMLYLHQEKLLYFPSMPVRHPDDNPKGVRHPGELGIPFEELYMVTGDGVRIHGWLLKQPRADQAITLVYFHGNAGNIGFRLPNAAEMYHRCGVNVFLVEYRGYGKSEGTPTEAGLVLDALAAIDALRTDSKAGVDPSKVAVFGRSLGGAVAVAAAEAKPEAVRAVALENTFLSVPHMVDVVMPFLRPLKPFVLRMKWPTDERIARLKQPVLFIAGQQDELVPPSHMERLFELCKSSKRMLRVRRGTHNDTWLRAGDRYYQVLKEFLDDAFKKGGASVSAVSCDELSVEGDGGRDINAAAAALEGPVDAIPTMPKLGPTLPTKRERRKED